MSNDIQYPANVHRLRLRLTKLALLSLHSCRLWSNLLPPPYSRRQYKNCREVDKQWLGALCFAQISLATKAGTLEKGNIFQWQECHWRVVASPRAPAKVDVGNRLCVRVKTLHNAQKLGSTFSSVNETSKTRNWSAAAGVGCPLNPRRWRCAARCGAARRGATAPQATNLCTLSFHHTIPRRP